MLRYFFSHKERKEKIKQLEIKLNKTENCLSIQREVNKTSAKNIEQLQIENKEKEDLLWSYAIAQSPTNPSWPKIKQFKIENERYKRALEKINGTPRNRGSAAIFRTIKEIIRSAFYPNDPCPTCKGTGEIPNPEGIHCSSCRSFHEYPMGAGGSCGPWENKKSVLDDYSCDKHEFLLVMLTCPACGRI